MVKKNNRINILEESDQLSDILDETKCYVLYFTATWCGPCRLISPHFEKFSETHNIEFFKIDIDECEEITHNFNIVSVPTFLFFKHNKEYYDKCEGSNLKKLTEIITSLDIISRETTGGNEKKDEIEDELEDKIEDEIENNTVFYNNYNNLENYGHLEPLPETVTDPGNISNEHPFLEAKNLETINTDINIQKEEDLDGFFNAPLSNSEINNLEDFYKLNISDIGDLNL